MRSEPANCTFGLSNVDALAENQSERRKKLESFQNNTEKETLFRSPVPVANTPAKCTEKTLINWELRTKSAARALEKKAELLTEESTE